MDKERLALYLAVALAGGGLGVRIFNKINSSIQMRRLHDRLTRSNKRLSELGLGKPSKYITDKLKASLGVQTPIIRVRDKELAKALGVDNNAFYVQPNYAEPYAEILKPDPSYKKHGMVVMGDEDTFSDTVTLAHELGHSKDYQKGELPSFTTTAVGKTLGTLGTIGLGLFAHRPMNEYLTDKLGIIPGALGTTALIALPAVLTSYWANKRQAGAETRASNYAKEALATLTGKMRREGAKEGLDKDLDMALQTYTDSHKYQMIDDISRWVTLGGLNLGVQADVI